MDLKILKSTLEQLEAERGVSKEQIIATLEDALAAAYKKEYGKRGQIIKAKFDLASGNTEFNQIKVVVAESMLKEEPEENESQEKQESEESSEETKVRFNPERHIMIEEAKKIKKDVKPGEELVFPLENKKDYGRIAAQTGKQVIIQRIREAERESIYGEFKGKEGEVVSGIIQRAERGNIFLDLGRATAVLPKDEQVWGERYRIGERIKALIFLIEQTAKGINIYLSRSHPRFLSKLFEMEVPEIGAGVVEIKSVAREAGSRSKIAVSSNKEEIDPVGSCVGQKGVRVSTVISELGGEKIDIIEWSENTETFIAQALSPAKIVEVELKPRGKEAVVTVDEDQVSLAIGKRGQNVRLAAKLTGWKIDIRSRAGESIAHATEEGKVSGKGVEPKE
ncbi:MAG: transcription termination/antitermination protein NusA [Candidatus Tagabacteria bacterium CG09_land_8_20_14_0_10_41_14]|uniref:Transcription termination/antitermination protein NusA n=2 Tax=Candidatus Tagaibacteriota TaxID=1817918 RepID=A0A2H0WKY8_9BACT|nr:MAG: transcription termination/antitermination protein NusA [Candidatus Tagabacteria bacterium CG09_land_8_20_14_0_10_41_14]PJE73031.1 MAG: transcription termination/antitermination protein NusA [Candidatus Tagabacteria bacterium CG10_big_fil_rev_8_21_14_0_10_40_13]